MRTFVTARADLAIAWKLYPPSRQTAIFPPARDFSICVIWA